MLDLLADLGRQSVAMLWLPLAAWSVIALAAEAVLRWTRPAATLALPVRGALLAALPLAVAAPVALRALAPDAAEAVAAAVPQIVWLPEVAIGPPASEVLVPAAGPPLGDLLLGLLLLLVGAVSLVALGRFVRSLAVALRTGRSLPTAGPESHAAVDDARQRLGVRLPIAVADAPPATAPFTVGWRRPVVALPTTLDPEERAVAALHEVAHVRRSDFAWHAAQRALSAVFAAHPLVWMLGRGLDLDRERAADAAVLAARPESRRAYADLLFSYATLPAPSLALGAAPGSSSLKSRIDAMTTPLPPSLARRLRWVGRLSGLLALVAVVGVTAAMSPHRAAPLGEHTGAVFVERVDQGSGQDGIATFDVYLSEGASQSDADTLAARIATENRAGFLPTALRVHFDGGTVERDILRGESTIVLSGDPAKGEQFFFYPPGSFQPTQEIQSVATVRDAEGLISQIRLQPGIDRAGGEDFLDRMIRFDGSVEAGDRFRVLLADGTVIDRTVGGASGTRPAAPASRRDTTEVYEVVDQMPQLIGGLASLQGRVVYPPLARDAGIEGTVVAQFIVNEEGGVDDIRVIRSPHEMLAQAAVAAIEGARFEPGQQNGQPVRVRFAVPISFRLAEAPPRAERPQTPDMVRAGDPEIQEVAEVQPRLLGGLDGLQARVVYPPLARQAGIEGQVIVQFVVNKEGRVEDATVLRSPDDMLSRAALEAVEASEFTPGRQGGEPVSVRFAVPVTFRLPASDGVDRGEYRLDGSRRDRPAPQRAPRDLRGYRMDGSRIDGGAVRFTGVDVTRLSPSSRQAFERTLAALPTRFASRGTAPGTAVVQYLVDDSGRVIDSEITRGSGALAQMAAFLVGTLESAETARPGPGGTWAGTFRLMYYGEG